MVDDEFLAGREEARRWAREVYEDIVKRMDELFTDSDYGSYSDMYDTDTDDDEEEVALSPLASQLPFPLFPGCGICDFFNGFGWWWSWCAVQPTGDNGATRAPIVVDLQREPGLSSKSIVLQFDSKSQQVSASALRHSLQDRLSKGASGGSRRGRADEIYLKLRTSTAPPLKLIDLPGIDQRAVDDSMNVGRRLPTAPAEMEPAATPHFFTQIFPEEVANLDWVPDGYVFFQCSLGLGIHHRLVLTLD
ncbi:uncharacterized protein LOC120645650 [Panicum virgatum]|uniref:uncharacterized protein LOC120645650 n=1 Tax=Panicum virgatum TaxID=38727 RepID=UPI0019D66DB3|nr:uncharacterized protein LOC120645650 [Panicum virgatum]